MPGSTRGPLHEGRDGYYDEHRHWRSWAPLLDDGARVRPETVPHDEIARHRPGCRCAPCARYPAAVLRRLRAAAPRAASPRL